MTRNADDMENVLVADSTHATVKLLPPVARFSLRIRDGNLAAASSALGFDLPVHIGKRNADPNSGAEALCLGPDEWTIKAPEIARQTIIDVSSGMTTIPHSLTEISDREHTIQIEGSKALDLLSIGCPRNLGQVAVGDGRRTVFDEVAIVLWRDGQDCFRVDIWRSFYPHICALLKKGCLEFG